MSVGKKNIYECPKGHLTVTVDTDEGVTPFMMSCKRPGCNGHASSMMYNVPQFLTAEYEWYRPTEMEGLSQQAIQHVKDGGLILREIPEAQRKAIPVQERLAMLRNSNPRN